MTLWDDTYDCIIVGAGIGGLVCGCVLAKAGMKVLIAEQHTKPGGYCTSFKRGAFTFDAAAHCFGGYRETGTTRRIFREIGVDDRLTITKSDPSDRVVAPDHAVSYRTDPEATIDEFRRAFPREIDEVRSFFQFLVNPDPSSFAAMRRYTFHDLMERYITNQALRFMIAAPLLGLGGLPPRRMSAFVGAKLFSEFLLDGGYHPQGGMQSLSDALCARFREFGGALVLAAPVTRIERQDRSVRGVTLKNGRFLASRFVVSNADATRTYLTLLEGQMLEPSFQEQLGSMQPSLSNFIAYLGLDSHFEGLPPAGTTHCHFSHYDLDRAYRAIAAGDPECYGGHMFYVSRELPTLLAIIPAPFRDRAFWRQHKRTFLDAFIARLERCSIPRLTRHIVHSEAATPQTLERYTGNLQGASFGWAGTPDQLAVSGFRKSSSIDGLYLAGHWTTHGLGISGVAYVGRDTATAVLRKAGKK